VETTQTLYTYKSTIIFLLCLFKILQHYFHLKKIKTLYIHFPNLSLSIKNFHIPSHFIVINQASVETTQTLYTEHVWLRGSVNVSYGSIKTSCLVNSYPRFQTSWGPHKLCSKHRISKSNYLLLLSWLLFRKRCNLYQKIN